jgi:hypothetical protein
VTPKQQKEWLAQWQRARGELERVHALELAALSAEQALAASEALLALADPQNLDERRRTSSGLVEQQRAFHRKSA